MIPNEGAPTAWEDWRNHEPQFEFSVPQRAARAGVSPADEMVVNGLDHSPGGGASDGDDGADDADTDANASAMMRMRMI